MPNDQQSSRKWRKKPTVIEAVQWDGGNIGEVMSLGPMRGEVDAGALFIDTLEGRMRADPGDWIIKGVKGEFYPCKPDIFTALHEPESSASSETAAIKDAARYEEVMSIIQRGGSVVYNPNSGEWTVERPDGGVSMTKGSLSTILDDGIRPSGERGGRT